MRAVEKEDEVPENKKTIGEGKDGKLGMLEKMILGLARKHQFGAERDEDIPKKKN